MVAVVAWATLGCGFCGDNPPLEPESRDLGAASGGGLELEMSATLAGRYGTEHHGGGRMTWTSESDEEHWSLSVEIGGAELEPLAALRNDEWVVWRGSEREAGVEALESLEVVSCPADDGVIVGVVGLDAPRWLAARAGDGWGFYAPFESAATDCAAASDAPAPAAHLRAVRDDALGTWIELEREREEHGGAGMGAEGRARRFAGVRACGVHVDRGEAEQAITCVWEQREAANASRGVVPRVVELIGEGPRAEPDLEAAMFRLAAPGGLPEHDDPELAELAAAHTAFAAGTYLSRAPTPERARAFVEAVQGACAAAPCDGWRVEAAAELAGELGDVELCDAVIALGKRLVEAEPGDPAAALGILRGASDCGSEEVLRGAMIASLSRRTLGEDVDRPGNCGEGAIIDGTYASNVCGSLPRFAGSWLGDHCHPDAVARAREVLAAVSDDRLHPYRNALSDGALRVLGPCDPDGLAEALRERGREELIPD